jgi:hypothetical protein
VSLVPTCCVCDALLRTYNGDTRCERCKQDCPTCGGDVAYCRHALPEPLTVCEGDPFRHSLRDAAHPVASQRTETPRTATHR